MKKISSIFLVLFLCFIFPLHAQSTGIKEYGKKFFLGKTPCALVVVGYLHDADAVNRLIDHAIREAELAHAQLDWRNPNSEVARLNRAGDKNYYKLSKNVLDLFQRSILISKWTDGAFDITASGKVGDYKSIKLSEGKSAVRLKKEGMQVRFDGILDGYLADLLRDYVINGGMNHVLAKVGTSYSAMGSRANGAWKVNVQDDNGSFAHRALYIVLKNVASSTANFTDYKDNSITDPRYKKEIPLQARGASIVMKNASEAQAVSNAVMVLGPQAGYDLLLKLGSVKGMIVDKQGKFFRTPGF
ncbi:MAG: hypothetical protein COX62_07295 [Deltaproteobacteria bacterium CG_4_10_14_0_2_um_filter_43_8]|nr:MAG: hypothetical protein COV43_08845 [Deltaproteobacteria bacterium CG11_big_fil_rev_8_21_14_0_20_42_23]PJA19105.1 MAG: hypothetical protein COX62_07295 [Deltaproteobacteria bacterium CG_4_10_14_0_2_um_filter_43_8]PJC64925.1 MAG: hypothetical protein CO021_01730 [Deltaproteobacteria bacterium CG_4_9_14_0_2_um_filter_42_21]